MSLYAVVSPSGSVLNLVTWDGQSTFNVAPNTLVDATGQPNAQIGGTYTNGVFTAPVAQPVVVPATVTAAQLKMALQAAGVLAAVSAAVAASPDPLVSIYWNNASTFDRADPRVVALGTAVGQTPAQMDAIFVAATQYPNV